MTVLSQLCLFFFFLEGGHIVVDVVVDSLPITSVEFIESSSSNCAANNGGENCDLFLWKTGNITMVKF